jgi:hypothetical protein
VLAREILDHRPVIHREDHLQNLHWQGLATGGHVLRVGALHRVDAKAKIANPVVHERDRRLQWSRIAVDALRVLQLGECRVIELQFDEPRNPVSSGWTR